MAYKHIQIPENGEQISSNDSGELNVPANPIIPFIEGDGIGTCLLYTSDAADE